MVHTVTGNFYQGLQKIIHTFWSKDGTEKPQPYLESLKAFTVASSYQKCLASKVEFKIWYGKLFIFALKFRNWDRHKLNKVTFISLYFKIVVLLNKSKCTLFWQDYNVEIFLALSITIFL